jgi:predicted ATPase/DNA-binding winged helix-turn-helix (wHTH) protein
MSRSHPAPSSSPRPVASSLAFGAFVLDREGGRLLSQGQPVDLAPKPWAVLVYLAEHTGLLVSKDELLDAVWGHRHVSDSVLKVAINSLRSKLGDEPASPKYIETVARRGYRFIASVGESHRAADGSASSASRPAPVAESTTPASGNLPAPRAALVGRELAAAELLELLKNHRLITLLGPGGVGKTQLALATARLDPPPNGVWLVRLEALADATPLLDTVARALSLGANASRSVEALANALSPLSMRIVLDNAEHLIDALLPLVVQCLAQAPRVQLLITSQTALRVSGEVQMPLQPLAVPPAGSADAPESFSAVALFVQRVQALQPQFVPNQAELQDIVSLCRLLDGLPLALELAAARVPLLGTAGVLSRMSNRFALLSRGTLDAPVRHQTLRAALEWSFALLGVEELRVLRRLSVFAGSFTPEMAYQVAGEPGSADWQFLDALQNLQDQNLLVTDRAQGQLRLRQLESVRALALQQLRSAGEEVTTQMRLAQALRDLFAAAQAQYTRTPLLQWLQPLRPEADNLRLAMSHALGRLSFSSADQPGRADVQLAVGLFSGAMLFWLRSGRKREAQVAYQALAAHVQPQTPPELRADYGLAVGSLAAYGQSVAPADALPWLDEAGQTFARQGDGRSAMLALYLHAALLQRMAPEADRTPLLTRMRAFEQADWSPRERNFAAWTEAVNAHGHGDLPTFRDFCQGDLQRAQASGDHAEAWVAAFGLGQALWSLGERQRAAQTLAQAVEGLRSHGLLREYATTVALAASMALVLDASAHSEAAIREAADVIRAEGMLWWMGDALVLLPAQRGDWSAALRLQAWIDGRMRALGTQRSPVAASLQEQFETMLAEARGQPHWREVAVDLQGALDDAEVLRLSFS